PAEARKALALHPGEPARASDVLAAGTRLLAALQKEGYALAKVNPPLAIMHPATDTLDVTFKVKEGPRVDLGPIRIAGLKTVNQSFVRRRLTVHQGDLFSPAALSAARQNLAKLPIFAVVSIRTADAVNAQGQLPVTFLFAERKLHVVSLDGSYSTDLGVGLGASWEDRNLFGNAEDLKLSASTNLGGTAVEGLGYLANATFTKPDFLERDQSLIATLGTVDQSLDAYDQVAINAGLALSRPILPHLRLTFGIAAERERITQDDIRRNFTLLGLPVSLAYDSTNNLLEPTSGVRAALTLTPTASFGPPSAAFVLAQLSASTYFDLSNFAGEKPGRSVLALRGLIGSALGVHLTDLPGDKRFYAGGSGTIRGYRYLSVGPQFPNGHPTGGTAVGTATVELRQRFLSHWGIAAFADAGDVSTSGNPFGGALRVGAGAGLRYYTPIGPIRVDVAFPLIRQEGGDRFELYIGLGEAF
ncbi:MAG: autotransporter assembly complex protein TamA, partial [Acetobacteraceae bacterium]